MVDSSATPNGATPEEWSHFDLVLGLSANLLPCVPASASVQVAPGSALAGKVGKIPSQFNSSGLAHGLLDWQKRQILSNELAAWRADRRLNICVRTGAISGVYAIDVDIDDTRADEVLGHLSVALGKEAAYRGRSNSHKLLVPFRTEGALKKRKIYLSEDHKGPAIELLADGQQFVAAGLHSSGVRYQWSPALPMDLPYILPEQLEALWLDLAMKFSATLSRETTIARADSTAPVDSVVTAISDDDWARLIDALRFLLVKVASNDEWSAIGYALLSLQKTRPAERLWLDFSKKAVGYEKGAPEAWWSAHRNQIPRTDFRHIFAVARRAGWNTQSNPAVFRPTSVSDTAALTQSTNVDLLPPPPEKPSVLLLASNFSFVVDQLVQELGKFAYTQGEQLVYVASGCGDDGIERSPEQKTIRQLRREYARKTLGESLIWLKATADGQIEIGPSVDHVNTAVGLGTWPTIRPLEAIARSPFMRFDGSICDTKGYDEASGVLFISTVEYPRVPTNPSREDARQAIERIRRPFRQFPWETAESESAFLAHVLSECSRLALDYCPMFWYSAPEAGSGKTLLQKSASIIAHGVRPAVRPWVTQNEEMRKTIGAALAAGDRSLLFDNVPDGERVQNPQLCAILTTERWTDRWLGASETYTAINRAVFSASGNNVYPGSDLIRRSLMIRLDANTDALADRRFDIPELEQYLLTNRAALLVDALTVVRAYRNEITPEEMPIALPSFEKWSRLVREPLIWLGFPDPVIGQKALAMAEKEERNVAFDILLCRFGERPFCATDIIRDAGGLTDSDGALLRALMDSGCSDPNSARAVGKWLAANDGRVFGAKKLMRGRHIEFGRQWHFVSVGGANG